MFLWGNTESQLGSSPSQVISQVVNSFFLPSMHNSSTMHNQTHDSIFHSHCSRPLSVVVQVVHCTKAPAKRTKLCKAMSRHMFSYFAGKRLEGWQKPSHWVQASPSLWLLAKLLTGLLAPVAWFFDWFFTSFPRFIPLKLYSVILHS